MSDLRPCPKCGFDDVICAKCGQVFSTDETSTRIRELEAALWGLKRLAANAILMARNGDYANGVMDSTGTIDQGTARASQAMANIESEAAAFQVKIFGTFYENELYYSPQPPTKGDCNVAKGE